MTYVDDRVALKSNRSFMKKFSIRDLERFSGIKAHTIRTWELRYGVPKPLRNDGNLRYYSLQEVDAAVNIAILIRNGNRISKVSALTPPEIERRLKHHVTDEIRKELAIKQLLIEMYSMDTDAFDATLDTCFLSWPVADVLRLVILPFLEKVELLWQGRQEAEEHFVVTAIRKKMLWAIERADDGKRPDRSVLLFLSDTKQLDLALLYTQFYLKHHGMKVLNMGNNVSADNLVAVFSKMQPHLVYTYLPKKETGKMAGVAAIMKEYLPHAKLVITSRPSPDDFYMEEDNLFHMCYTKALDFLCGVTRDAE